MSELAEPVSDIVSRKDEHLEVVLSGRGRQATKTTGFEAFDLVHCALPEIDLADVSTSCRWLERDLAAPLLVSAMTGGPARAGQVNAAIAEACEALRIPFGVGSQRVAVESDGQAGLAGDLRHRAPSVPILGNLGAAQLLMGYGADEAKRLVDMIEADCLMVHLNPMQEAMQERGDTNWRGVARRIGALARELPCPVGVKEVGNGLSGTVARRLRDEGVSILDVAGAGGTSWTRVEAERNADPHMRAVAEAFHDWGIPTTEAVRAVRAAAPDAHVIASGGIRNGVDVAKAIALGADMAGQAAATLPAALDGADALTAHFRIVIDQLRIAMFGAGTRDLNALRDAEVAAARGAS